MGGGGLIHTQLNRLYVQVCTRYIIEIAGFYSLCILSIRKNDPNEIHLGGPGEPSIDMQT